MIVRLYCSTGVGLLSGCGSGGAGKNQESVSQLDSVRQISTSSQLTQEKVTFSPKVDRWSRGLLQNWLADEQRSCAGAAALPATPRPPARLAGWYVSAIPYLAWINSTDKTVARKTRGSIRARVSARPA
jgi:hypothetical protein